MPSSTQWLVPCLVCRQQHLVSGAQIRDGTWLTTPCEACQKGNAPGEPSPAGGGGSQENPGAEG